MAKYALARVSTEEQNEERQVEMFLALGIPLQNILVEKESGKSTARVEFHRFIKKLKQSDVLYIENVDRLARDYDGILNIWHTLTRKGVIIKVLDTPILDTDTDNNDLSARYMRDNFLLTQAFKAESDWHLIKKRQSGGIATAKARGTHLGRPKKPFKFKKKDFAVIQRWKKREITTTEAMKLLRRGRTSFYDLVKIYEQKAKGGEIK